MSDARIELLQKIPMFAGLNAEIAGSVLKRAAAHPFAAGDLLFREGDASEGLYILVEGSVKISKSSPSGRQLTLAIEKAPATLAELPLFDGGAYLASAQAVDAVVSLFIHKRDFRAICLEHPELPLQALAIVGRRLRGQVGLVESVTFGRVRQRLARALLELADLAQSDSFSLPWTHHEIALNLGTVREVVSRNLNRFQATGLIQMNHKGVVLTDREGLEREAEAGL
jgi:CRP/FNR family transcriptional regulator